MSLRNVKSVKIFGRAVPIKQKDLFSEGDEKAHYDLEACSIAIHKHLKNKEFDQILIHEIIHAIFHRVGIDQGVPIEAEETIAQAVSVALTENFHITKK